ncbi:MAG: Eco57I restriction-modification methylase domain-containing protein, partial [Proteocatella sp.]
ETCYYGKFDYCYAFIEASIRSLKNNGKLAYLIPSNIFKNQFAKSLREYIVEDLTDIYDFTNKKLFKDKLTASAIIIYEANSEQMQLRYHNVLANKSKQIVKADLNGKWQFESVSDIEETRRFGDYFHAASSIATLLNGVYIIQDYSDEGDYINTKGNLIEKSILRRAISPRSKRYKKEEYIIFPYAYHENNLVRFSEAQFAERFPRANEYMEKSRIKLSKRDNDKGISWFEYGRTQALAHLNQEKLLLSTLVTNQVHVYILEQLDIPTSGIYIVKKGDYDLRIAKRALESLEFYNYAKNIGVISNGSSYRIAPKDINNFIIPENYFVEN